MTAYTHNTGGTVNFDALAVGSVNATLDTHVISANTLFVVRTDTYACANHTIAGGSLDTVSWSGTGGTMRFDPTYVRVIAYTGGSGNSPAYGAAISQGGVSGVFLGAWTTNWQSDPIVAGAAIGAAGFIKIGGVTGGAFAAGALTGITATCSGPDVQGWQEIKAPETATITMSNIAKVESIEAWFELGVTNGSRGQILSCPTTATVAGVWAGIWIETAAGSGVYEQYHGMGSMAALATFATDARNKVFWQTTAGIRIGDDSTNGVGYLPPTGCKVRIPATILTNCTRSASGSGPRVLPNATIATRQGFVTTNAGTVDLKTCVIQWYMNMAQAFLVRYKSCTINDSMVFTEVASPLDVDDCIVAPTQAQLNFALNITSCFGGGTIKNSSFNRFSLAASGAYTVQTNYVTGVTFQNNVIHSLSLATRGDANTGAWTCTKTVNCVWDNNWMIGGRKVHNQCIAPSHITGYRYTDTVISTATVTTNPMVLVEFSPGTSSVVFDGSTCPVSFPIANQQPYTALFGVTGALGVEIRNIGTKASPLICNAGGSATGVIVQGGGNSATVRVKRCYVTGLRTGPVAGVNSDSDWVVENCNNTTYAGAGVTAILNATIKGCRYIGATTGQVSVYGTHWRDVFTAATTGSIWLEMNEPTAASAAQCAKTGGLPQFSSTGNLLLTKAGDQVTWEMPYYCKGHTAFAVTAVGVTGTNVTFTSGSEFGNHTLEFQIDLNNGAGYNGTWQPLNATTLRTFTLSASLGFKLKIRATTLTVAANNILTNIRIYTESTDVAQDNYYPINLVTTSLAANTSLVGAEIRVYDMDNNPVGSLGTEITGTESSGASFSFITTEANTVWIQIMKTGYNEFGYQYTTGSTNTTLPVTLVADTNT